MAEPKYKEIAAQARKRRDEALPTKYKLSQSSLQNLPRNLTSMPEQHLSAAELEIVDSKAEDILLEIRERRWSALEVTEAFCKAATIAHQLTNCLTEILFEQAIERATSLDEHLERTGNVVGPFHGLPISLKDCFVTPPHPSSIGMACYVNEPTTPEQESLLPQILKELGAVFYCKTNTPVAMMMMETNNNVWGETRSPIHTGTSAGGSSGGEAALLAMKGSTLGIGTDIGGSIRMPAAWTYLYGLKPSAGRFPSLNIRSGIPGQEYVLATNGPMSRHLETLQLYCSAVLSEERKVWHLDPKCLPIPWRKNVIQPLGRKLRLGIVGNHDLAVTCHPPVERALEETKEALLDAGHDVFEWAPIDHPKITEVLMTAFQTFGGSVVADALNLTGEPFFKSMKGYEKASREGENILGPSSLREMTLRRNKLQKDYLNRWRATATPEKEQMDGVIMAVTPWAAARLRVTEELSYVGYTGVFNILDLPSCTFPVTFADKNLDRARKDSQWNALNPFDAKIQADYDPVFYHGAPVSLQLISQRLEEEKVLEMVSVVSSILRSQRASTANRASRL